MASNEHFYYNTNDDKTKSWVYAIPPLPLITISSLYGYVNVQIINPDMKYLRNGT